MARDKRTQPDVNDLPIFPGTFTTTVNFLRFFVLVSQTSNTLHIMMFSF